MTLKCTGPTISEMKSVFLESRSLLRTSSDHSIKCDELESAVTRCERDVLSTEYGINHRSNLDELKYFDVCSGALVQDVMHA